MLLNPIQIYGCCLGIEWKQVDDRDTDTSHRQNLCRSIKSDLACLKTALWRDMVKENIFLPGVLISESKRKSCRFAGSLKKLYNKSTYIGKP